MKKICFATLACIVLIFSLTVPAFADDITLITDTSTVDIDMTFNGCKIVISGQAPEGSDVYVKFSSPSKTVNLSKMGKKALLWMPVENVTVESIPGMFQVLTSAPIDKLGHDLRSAMGVDKNYDYMLATAKVLEQGDNPKQLSDPVAKEFLDGLVGISQEKGLYGINEGAITREGNLYKAVLLVPADIPRGISTIEAYAVKNNEIVAHTSESIATHSIGIVQTIGSMAVENSFAYGFLAVGIALFAGLSISAAFKKINQFMFKEGSDIGAQH